MIICILINDKRALKTRLETKKIVIYIKINWDYWADKYFKQKLAGNILGIQNNFIIITMRIRKIKSILNASEGNPQNPKTPKIWIHVEIRIVIFKLFKIYQNMVSNLWSPNLNYASTQNYLHITIIDLYLTKLVELHLWKINLLEIIKSFQ